VCRHRTTPSLVVLVTLCVQAGCDRAPITPQQTPSYAQEPNEPLRVRVTAQNFQWHLRYPGPDRRLDTPDDILAEHHLHVPTDTEIQVELCSGDFVYTLYLPDYELVEMAFPGRPYLMKFNTGSAGTSEFLGSQMCGFTHKDLLADLVVLDADDFQRWLESPTAR
jgi:cytochrome c oxidase subunit 2